MRFLGACSSWNGADIHSKYRCRGHQARTLKEGTLNEIEVKMSPGWYINKMEAQPENSNETRQQWDEIRKHIPEPSEASLLSSARWGCHLRMSTADCDRRTAKEASGPGIGHFRQTDK